MIDIYNQKRDLLASDYVKEFDFGIIGDILLDLFRHKQDTMVNIQSAVNDYAKTIKLGSVYSLKQFLARM